MDRGGISPKHLQVLRLVDDIAGRFEVEAGFPLPCVFVKDLLTDYAARFGVTNVDERDMDDLVREGLLKVMIVLHDGKGYALTEKAQLLMRESGAKAA